MKVLVVYDTSADNCRKLHLILKRYLFWNQRSCFEGNLSEAEFFEIKKIIEREMVESSHICYYLWKDEKTFIKEQIGKTKGFTSNCI
jgi:CRISPR-associated protein Cas2